MPLAECLDPDGRALLDGLIAARRWDIYRDPFEDRAHFDGYIDATSGHLMWTAARLAGAGGRSSRPRYCLWRGGCEFFSGGSRADSAGRMPLMDDR